MVDLVLEPRVRDACAQALEDENTGRRMKEDTRETLLKLLRNNNEGNGDLCVSHRLLKELADSSEGRLSYSDMVLRSRPIFPRPKMFKPGVMDKETKEIVTAAANLKHKEMLRNLYQKPGSPLITRADRDYSALIALLDILTLAAATGAAAFFTLGRVTKNIYMTALFSVLSFFIILLAGVWSFARKYLD